MTRCGICNHWIWPWQRYTFVKQALGAIENDYHTPCYQRMQRIWQEDADRWERVRSRYTATCLICGKPTATSNKICSSCTAQAAIRARQEERM